MAKHYTSDITRFLQQYKAQHPEVELRQLQGRALLWDKTLDAELQEAFKAGRLPQQPYVYYQTTQA